MLPSGDFSVEDRLLMEELTQFEKLVDDDDVYPSDQKAQIYTCLAHDWYCLYVEEEGNRLLLKAEKTCPGYFKGPVVEQQRENPDFDVVIKGITLKLLDLMGGISDET